MKPTNLRQISLVVFPAAILLLYYIAYFPGCISDDSIAYFQYFNDHHPLFFLVYIRMIKFILGGFDGYILLNILLFSLLFSRVLIFFLSCGMSFRFLLFFAIIIPLLPVTGYMMVTYWKDIVYAITVCYLSFLLIQFVVLSNQNKEPGKYYFWELFIAFLFLIGTRQNGIITSAITIIPLLLYLKKYRIKFLLSFSLAFISITAIGFSAKQFFGAGTGWMSLDHLLVRHLSVYLHESKLDSSGTCVLSDIMPLKAYEDGFNYFSHDGYAYGTYAVQYRNNVKRNKWQVRKAFCRNLIKYPMVFLKSEFLMTQLIWRPVPVKGSFRNTYCTTCGKGESDKARLFYDFLLRQSDRIDKPFYTRIIFWSGSFHVWVILFLGFAILGLNGHKPLLPFLPAAGNLLSLFIALVSQDFRYLYGEVLVLPFLFIYFIYLYGWFLKQR